MKTTYSTSEIQQSDRYAAYIRSLGWSVERVGGRYAYIKRLPFVGGLMKLQRVQTLPPIRQLMPVMKAYGIRTLAIEPDPTVPQAAFTAWAKTASRAVRLNTSAYLPTKTYRVDVTADTDAIFRRFSEAKRRAVRRAQKHGVTVAVGKDISSLIRIKNASAGFLGFITTHGLDRMWPQFAPEHADTVLACSKNGKLVAGILLFYWNRIAYYWVAGSTREGKKLFAPTLLVWHALLQAKKRGARSLDFVGVWDERMPAQNREWLGFTKFKEGFGGTALYYPIIR